MKALSILLTAAAAVALLAGCGDKPSSQTASPNPADVNNPLVNAKRTADKTLDVSYLNQAVQLFNVQEGRFPTTLEELTPKYVAKIPDPPLGYRINYDAAKGDVTVVRQ
jgi:type IV pilus biogenesis protein CpaD/CtpE